VLRFPAVVGSEAAPLLTLLRRIRRRLRLWRAVEGAVGGGAAGAIALALVVAAAHLGGHSVGPTRPIAVLASCVLAGALLRGARRIPLVGCARFADAALDRQDRVLSAFCLRDDATLLARALVADAVARTRTLTPGGAVAPRRPKGLSVLAMAAVVLAAAALAPVRSRAARLPAPPPPAPGVPLMSGALDVEREAARRATADAAVLHDPRLAALAADLEQTLRKLAAGQLSDGDALEKLSALQRDASAAAEQAARDAQAFEAAKKALAAETATRAASEALAGDDSDAARARAALATAAADKPTETARALSAAAAGVGAALDRSRDGDGGNSPRRLNRDGHGAEPTNAADSTAANARDGERRLERLQRDLDDAASACRAGDPSCKSQAEKSSDNLRQLGGRGASAESLRRLARAVRQMRERLGRGEMRDGDQSAMRGFERRARGESVQSGEGRGQGQGREPGQDQRGDGVGQDEGRGAGAGDSRAENGAGGDEGPEGQSQGAGKEHAQKTGKGSEGGDGKAGEGTGEAAALLTERRTTESTASSAPGDGQGSAPGGPPLGKRGDMQARGRETEARIANGAGPNRAEVIGGAADRGFAQRGYARVFADYQAAVEDALATTAVPEGRRYVVRRYFDLIRPRAGKGHAK
jgi:hypothetical protein